MLGRQTDRQADRQIDKQTDRHAHTTTIVTLAAHERRGLKRILIIYSLLRIMCV